MENLLAWLQRLETSGPEAQAAVFYVRASVPADFPAISGPLLGAKRLGTAPNGFMSVPGESVLIGYPDRGERTLPEERSLITELGAILSFVSGRRIELLPEIRLRAAERPDQITFLGIEDVFDRRINAPVDHAMVPNLLTTLGLVRGMSRGDARAVGAAISLHYASLLLYDRDIAAAYGLLVAGIEALASRFCRSQPPGEWDGASRWLPVFEQAGLSPAQVELIVAQLRKDQRPSLTHVFADYGSTRPREEFFEEEVEDWIVPSVVGGSRLPGGWQSRRRIRDEIPPDRTELAASLRITYRSRSRYFHGGARPEFRDLVRAPSEKTKPEFPLTYAGLRLLLLELIRLEVAERGQDTPLPKDTIEFVDGEKDGLHQ